MFANKTQPEAIQIVNNYLDENFEISEVTLSSTSDEKKEKLKAVILLILPILKYLVHFPFVPAKWKRAITMFLEFVETSLL